MRTFGVLFLAVSLLAGCGGLPVGVAMARSDVPRAAADPAAAAEAARAINAFGLDLYRALLDSQPANGNLVISPASIAIALAMARAGARGKTAAQMDAVLYGIGSAERAAAINALDQALSSRSGSFPANDGKSYSLSLRIANAPFAQRDYEWQQAFLDALAANFGAGLWLVDYRTDYEGARHQINGWVDEQTEQRIPELLAAGTLNALTRLVLVNAIYLKAPWLTPFVPESTQPAPFRLHDGSSVDVPTMRQQEALPYAAGDGWQAVELPYVGGALAMTIIVPDDLAAFESTLDGDAFAAVVAGLAEREVALSLPRFGTETKAELGDLLTALGMPDAFDPNLADFSGMTSEERLYIAAVIHQANIDVDEKGTEAAAATAVVMEATGMPMEPVTMRVDRPFLFAVRDTHTGAILFLGRITEP
jgi:serpin B